MVCGACFNLLNGAFFSILLLLPQTFSATHSIVPADLKYLICGEKEETQMLGSDKLLHV